MVPCCNQPNCPSQRRLTLPDSLIDIKPLLPASTFDGFIERMWAHQTIHKLLKLSDLDSDNKDHYHQKVLELSLKVSVLYMCYIINCFVKFREILIFQYQFVTKLR